MFTLLRKMGFPESIIQFVKFGMVGVVNTVVSYVLYVTVLWLLHSKNLSWDYIVGNIIAFTLSVLCSFVLNSRFVFKDRQEENKWKTLVKTYISYGFTGIILNNVLSYIWIQQIGVSKYIAPLINLVISVPLNFILNKFWAFRGKNG